MGTSTLRFTTSILVVLAAACAADTMPMPSDGTTRDTPRVPGPADDGSSAPTDGGTAEADGSVAEDAGDVPDASDEDATTPPAPVEPVLVRAVDVSHWTRTLTDSDVDCLVGESFVHVIVGTQILEITRQQLEIAIRGGMTVDLYVYLYWNESITDQVQEALDLAAEFPQVGRIWLDVEESPAGRSAATLSMLVNEGLAALGGFPGGIYTGKGFWQSYMGDTTEFADVPLWYALYDNEPTLDGWDDPVRPERFGGWERPTAKQYMDNHVHVCGLALDHNVMWVAATPAVVVDRATPPDDGDPPPAPADLRPNGITVTTTYVRPTAPTIREATRYEIAIESQDRGVWRPYGTFSRAVSSMIVYPVIRNVPYRFRMRASNAHGFGPWSEYATFDFRPR